jgi:hypothetical protein
MPIVMLIVKGKLKFQGRGRDMLKITPVSVTWTPAYETDPCSHAAMPMLWAMPLSHTCIKIYFQGLGFMMDAGLRHTK